jgi:hypothetical protein
MSDQNRPDLVLCHSCGDRVPRLGPDDLCPLCEEIDARVEAQLASAMADYADHAIGVALDYLHPDDVREIVDRGEQERGGPPGDAGRLKHVYARADRFLEVRSARAERRRDGHRMDRGRMPPPADRAE